MRIALFVLLTFWLASCGPTIKRSFDTSILPPRKIAFLPPMFPESLREERAAIIRTQLESKLSNVGYLLVERDVVDKLCGTAACPNRAALIKKYGVDAFVETSVSSASKNGFLAGYVDELRGELTLKDPQNQELFKVSHLETERGGFLFNSGQIIEALRTQVQHSGEAPFEILAAKFAREVAAKFPTPQAQSNVAPVAETVLSRSTSRRLRNDVFEICAEGSSGVLASALIQGARTTLREVTPGRYCGIYWLNPKFMANVQVEVRSHFGQAIRATVNVGGTPVNATSVARQSSSAI